ncbi:MAG: TIGR04282 family arsenosugar biosynthesis glycosyltransferase [candidate division Zixibacteria bacterium]|nr:TIGR04282 family arsenosugar biosynthesis glycosyltransferase [candidate division Zixibacteria bacterium]
MRSDNPKNTYEFSVGLMAKAPQIGKVKTRLASAIGEREAYDVYCEMLERIVSELVQKSCDTATNSIHWSWFVDPPDMVDIMRNKYPGFGMYTAQSDGDLGQRMQTAMTELLKDSLSAVLIGADIPDLKLKHISAAFETLQKSDAVFGPTTDGGYYLIGMNRVHPEIFGDIPWSSNETLGKTLSMCDKCGIRYRLLDDLSDLDTTSDFDRIIWRPRNFFELTGLRNSGGRTK